MRPSNLILTLVILGLTVSALAIPAKSVEKKSLPTGTSSSKDTKKAAIEPKVEIDSESTDSKKDVERAKKSAEVSRVCVEVHSPKHGQSGAPGSNCDGSFQPSDAQIIVPQDPAGGGSPSGGLPGAGGDPIYVIPGGDYPGDGGVPSTAVTVIPGGGSPLYPGLYPSAGVTIIPGSGYPGSGFPGSGFPGSGYPGSGYPGSGYPVSGLPGSGLPGYPPLYPGYYPSPLQPSSPLIVVSNPSQLGPHPGSFLQPQTPATLIIPGHPGSHHNHPSVVECNCHTLRSGGPSFKSGSEVDSLNGVMGEGDPASQVGPSPSGSPMEFGQARSMDGSPSPLDQTARHHKYPVVVTYGGGAGGYPQSAPMMAYASAPSSYPGMPYVYGAGIRNSEGEPLSPAMGGPMGGPMGGAMGPQRLWQNPLNRNAGLQSLPSGATSQPMYLAQGPMGSPMNGSPAYRLAGPGASVYQQSYHSTVQSVDGGLRPYSAMTNCMPFNGQPMGPMLRFAGQQTPQPLKYTAGPTNLPMPLHRHYRQPENSEDTAQAESATGQTLGIEQAENPTEGSPKHVRETEKFPESEQQQQQQQQQQFVLSGPVEQMKAKRETQEKKSESTRKA